MPKARKKAFFEEIKHFTIYVMVDQIYMEFYVWKTTNPSLKSVFEKHYFLSNSATKEMFQRGKDQKKPPAMFVLETVNKPESEANRHCVAWTKYFLDLGYQNCNYKITQRSTDERTEEIQKIYVEIQNRPFSDVCNNRNRICKEYGTLRKPKDRTRQATKITITLEPEEYKKLSEKAQKLAMTPTGYVKQMAQEGQVIRENYAFFQEYIEKLSYIERRLRGIMKTIYEMCKYVPADLQNIQNLSEQVKECHFDAMKQFKKHKTSKRT